MLLNDCTHKETYILTNLSKNSTIKTGSWLYVVVIHVYVRCTSEK